MKISLTSTRNIIQRAYARLHARYLWLEAKVERIRERIPGLPSARILLSIAGLLAIVGALFIAVQVLLGPRQAFTEYTLPYVQNFDDVNLRRWFTNKGVWTIRNQTLAQTIGGEEAGQLHLPFKLPADQSYHVSVLITLKKDTRAAGLVFNSQYPDLTEKQHRVYISHPQKDRLELVSGNTDESGSFIPQAQIPLDVNSQSYRLDVFVYENTYLVMLNGQKLIEKRPLVYHNGLIGFYTLGPATFDTFKLTAADTPNPGNLTYTSDFDQENGGAGWVPFSGTWRITDKQMRQSESTLSDAGIAYETSSFQNYTLRATLQHTQGVGGGVLFNMPSPYQINSANAVRFSDETDALLWGFYDEQGNFERQGYVPIEPVAQTTQTIQIYSGESSYDIYLNDQLITRSVPMSLTQGHVGLLTSHAAVTFLDVSVFPLFGSNAITQSEQLKPPVSSPTPMEPTLKLTNTKSISGTVTPKPSGKSITATASITAKATVTATVPIKKTPAATVAKPIATSTSISTSTSKPLPTTAPTSISSRPITGSVALSATVTRMVPTATRASVQITTTQVTPTQSVSQSQSQSHSVPISQSVGVLTATKVAPAIGTGIGISTTSVASVVTHTVVISTAPTSTPTSISTSTSTSTPAPIATSTRLAPTGTITPSVPISTIQAFQADFTGDMTEQGWQTLSGEWHFENGALVQSNANGADLSVIYNKSAFKRYSVSVTFAHNQNSGAGIVFNIPGRDKLAGANMVRYSERRNNALIWGSYDANSRFQGQGFTDVEPAGTDSHTLRIVVEDTTYAIYLDDKFIVDKLPLQNNAGYIGLLTTKTNATYQSLEVTRANAPAKPTQKVVDTFGNVRTLNGNWSISDGVFTQSVPNIADYMVNLGEAGQVFTAEMRITLPNIADPNNADAANVGGGFIFHMGDRGSKRNAYIVRLRDGGKGIWWGSTDDTGHFQGQGSAPITNTTPSRSFNLKLFVQSNLLTIYLNQNLIAQDIPMSKNDGWIGLLSYGGPVIFDHIRIDLAGGEFNDTPGV